MSNEMSRRDFLKNLKKIGITAGVGSAVLFLGTSSLNAGSIEDASARGMCGSGLNCSGGGGECGAGLNCGGSGAPGGSGQCGSGLNCSGGGGQCGSGLNCAGS